MQAHGSLAIAMFAALVATSTPSLAAGMGAFIHPAIGHGVHWDRPGHGHDADRLRHHDFGLVPLVVPPLADATATEARAAAAVATPADVIAPVVIAAPECAQPRRFVSAGPRIIYVSEALEAPSHESQGVTIIYGRSHW